jgi:hypothetical protein
MSTVPAPDLPDSPRLRHLGIHGPRQSGKTCFLTVLHRFRKADGGAVVIKDEATSAYLEALWNDYLAQGKPTPRTAGTPTRIRFDLQAGGHTWDAQTRDYPGERVQRPLDAETKAWLESCDAILVFVDSTSPPDQLAERLNEVDLLLAGLRELSHDGHTIARPLALVLTKWDTQGPLAAADPEREEQRALAFLTARPEFRQLYHALLQAGHPDRVKVFPVSAFGANRGGTDPPEGGPRTPLNLHAPLVWAMRLGDERLVESAQRRAEERLRRRWADYRGALAEYNRLVADRGLNKGPLFDEEIEPERQRLKQLWHRRKLRTLGVLLPLLLALAGLTLVLMDQRGYEKALAALDDREQHPEEVAEVCRHYTHTWNPMSRLLGRVGRIERGLSDSLQRREEEEFTALASFRERHGAADEARQRAGHCGAFLERWPSSGYVAQINVWKAEDEATTKAHERASEHRGDYDTVCERVKTLTEHEQHDRILEEYDTFLKKWPVGEHTAAVRARKAAAIVARQNKYWAEVVRHEQRYPRDHEGVLNKARPFLVSGVAPIREQAHKMLVRHERDWDREDYQGVRKACNEARDPEGVRLAQRKAQDYVAATYPPRRGKLAVQRWLTWFEGLQKPQDYRIKVRTVEIPRGSALRDLYGKECVRVHIRVGGVSHVTGWHKGKGTIELGDEIGPFKGVWGKEQTIEITAEEYDFVSANDKASGRKTDPTFVLFWADGVFKVRCKKNKDVKIYLECPKVLAPRLPAYEE